MSFRPVLLCVDSLHGRHRLITASRRAAGVCSLHASCAMTSSWHQGRPEELAVRSILARPPSVVPPGQQPLHMGWSPVMSQGCGGTDSARAAGSWTGSRGECSALTEADKFVLHGRTWEAIEPTVGGTSNSPDVDRGQCFTLVCYNVLSQHLYNAHPELYRHADRRHCDWRTRAPRIWHQITQLSPDVVCLQEVEETDINTFWRPRCEELDYTLLYKRRTQRGKRDGCAMLVRRSAFSVDEATLLEYHRPSCATLNRDNVAIVAKLRSLQGAGDLLVATTHLLFNPKRSDIRLAQLSLLMAEMDGMAWCRHQQRHLPLVLCGDFNLQPHTPVYRYVTDGYVEYAGRYRRSMLDAPLECTRLIDAPLLSPELGVSCRSQHRTVVRSRHLGDSCLADEEEGADGQLSHVLAPLRSVYGHGVGRDTEASTYQNQWVTVDYIFHGCRDARLRPLTRLQLPPAPMCRSLTPYPSQAMPSDHLPLAARFHLRPPLPSEPPPAQPPLPPF